jgi:squalene-hopene/tetraprenyl-beta-curcumene cyclase
LSFATESDHEAAARTALERGRAHLLSVQTPAGYWKAELETNVTMDAEDLMLRQFLGIRGEQETRGAAAWIRSHQNAEGGWGNWAGGPSDLSTTIEAWVALRLAGDPPDAFHMRRAAELALDKGGIENARVFTRLWLALFGEWSWRDLPALPPEVILLPAWFPLNIYDFGCWARQTIVPLTVVAAHRPARPLGVSVRELRTGVRKETRAPLSTWAGRFQALDRALHLYERRPLRRLRRSSLALAAEWILRRQEHDGGWGGIQPPWVYSIMALELLGYPRNHPALAKAIAGLDDFVIHEGGLRRMEACQSPVWDTVLAMVALTDAGVPGSDPAIQRAADWVMREEIRIPGDWAVRRPNLEPSGFAFEFANDNYPDVDDTAEAVMALRAVDWPERKADLEATIGRAFRWTLGMQCKDGGFAAFDADNTRALCRELPFCDFGEVIDPPSADVTAHVLEMLGLMGRGKELEAREARAWLLRSQEPDGSWFGRWGANYLYGTGAAVPALVRAGEPRDSLPIRRAVRWLEGVQNPDGGWGESLASYVDRSQAGRGASTASQTAWALLALLAADGRSPAIERGVGWLARTQRPDGDWDEPEFTGTGFPGDFYIRYHLYRRVFPLMALGRYLGTDPHAVR